MREGEKERKEVSEWVKYWVLTYYGGYEERVTKEKTQLQVVYGGGGVE